MKQFNNAGFKNFQDFEPVVLKKTKSTNSYSTQKSNTNVHIDNKNNLDGDEIVPIVKYSQEQIDIINVKIKAEKHILSFEIFWGGE
jgi:hypothetical protein